MDMNGQRVVLLGGTSGIGFATAAAAAQAGAQVVVASSRRESVDRALARLPESADGHVVDLSRENEIRDLFGRIGAFDHLVFTAGEPLALADLAATSLDDARRFFEIRYWGALAAVKHASGNIGPDGSIVLSSGVAGIRPRRGWTVAASVCGAVEALTRALAVELAPIRVNAVAPGLVRTEMWDGLPAEAREKMYRERGAALPAGRVGEAADIARTHLYLMRNRFTTGTVVVVDGGSPPRL